MEYVELYCVAKSPGEYVDIVIARLAEMGYEAFEETENGVKAYIQAGLFTENYLTYFTDLQEAQLSFSHQLIPFQNWNSIWESNFEPVVINDKIYIRASFHPSRKEFNHEIIIQPKMAFGTGHHATTSLMMENMLDLKWKNKNVLDMGCGTGILAILASQLGADNIVAIDNDDIAVANTIENAAINKCTNISALCGDASLLNDFKFDIALANINRNIILEDIDKYNYCMNDEALILLSGFYVNDAEMIILKCQSLSMKLISTGEKDKWSCLVFQKQ